MIFHVLTLFPEAFAGFLSSSILGKAIQRGLITVNLINVRDFALDKHRTCDEAPYGGGPGMLMKADPLAGALESVQAEAKPVIYLTPSGVLLDQKRAEAFSREEEMVLLCGHYEGIDQRIIDKFVTTEISIGDYVLSSGVTASMVMIDTITRLVNGVIKEESHRLESFQNGLLEYPQYTRPEDFRGMKVPEVLLSGHHALIEQWRLKESLKKTLKNRPEFLHNHNLGKQAQKLLEEIKIMEGEDHGFNEEN